MAHDEAPAQASRDRLLEAGKKLMSRDGYERTSTSAIVREAGTSESQLMRYFGGKAGLLKAIFERDWGHLNADLRGLLEDRPDAHEGLRAILELFIKTMHGDHDMARLMLFEGRRLRGHRREVTLSQGFAEFVDLMQGVIKGAQQNREIDPELDPVAVSTAIMGLAEGMIRDRLIYRELNNRYPFSEGELRKVYTVMTNGLFLKSA